MQTYRYRFHAEGDRKDRGSIEKMAARMEGYLKDGPDCLAACCIFPTDSCTLDHVSLEWDEAGNLSAVDVHTYTQMWEGGEEEFFQCMEDNMQNAADDMRLDYAPFALKGYGTVTAMGLEGDVPKTLYHIMERDKLESVMKEGLIPGRGNNGWKSAEDFVYLADEKDLATWISVLQHADDPLILEIDTEGLDIEPGRTFDDRGYMGAYGEYRTKGAVPPSAIKQADLGSQLGARLAQDVSAQYERAKETGMTDEPERGMERLKKMGVMAVQEGALAEDAGKEPKQPEMDFGELPWDDAPEKGKPEFFRYRLSVGYKDRNVRMDNQMAPYESGRMKDAMDAAGIKGVKAVRFEQQPDGIVESLSVYMKKPVGLAHMDAQMEKASDIFNSMSDDVHIELGSAVSCGRSAVEGYDDSFSDAVARIRSDSGLAR